MPKPKTHLSPTIKSNIEQLVDNCEDFLQAKGTTTFLSVIPILMGLGSAATTIIYHYQQLYPNTKKSEFAQQIREGTNYLAEYIIKQYVKP